MEMALILQCSEHRTKTCTGVDLITEDRPQIPGDELRKRGIPGGLVGVCCCTVYMFRSERDQFERKKQ